MSTTDAVVSRLDAATAWQEELYTHLHRHPELSMQETQTAAEITRRLESFGYRVRQVGGGVVGVLENGPGPTVLFRADIDALPVEEATDLPYRSEVPGVMHACGHDLPITAGLGAAAVLAETTDAWSGTYVALFQPGEETAQGAQAMVEDGLADAIPRPDVALGQHVLAAPAAGEVATAAGPVLSTAASVRVTVHGKGSHGSMPHLGVDPVVLAASPTVSSGSAWRSTRHRPPTRRCPTCLPRRPVPGRASTRWPPPSAVRWGRRSPWRSSPPSPAASPRSSARSSRCRAARTTSPCARGRCSRWGSTSSSCCWRSCPSRRRSPRVAAAATSGWSRRRRPPLRSRRRTRSGRP